MNVEAIAAVTEGKITRAELVELAIESLRKKLEEEHTAVTAELDAQRKVKPSLKEALALFKLSEPSIKFEKRMENDWTGTKYVKIQKGWQLTLSATLPMEAIVPARVLKAIARYDELKPKRDALVQQLYRLKGNAKQARVELIKQALEQSPAGQKVLAAQRHAPR